MNKPFYKKWWFWMIIVIVVLAIVGVTSNEDEESDQEGNRESSTTAEDDTAKYTKVDLQQMLDDLNENALKAEKTYNNAYVEVTGKIANFDSDGSYITIEPIYADEWNFETVMCNIKNKDQLDILLEKSKGDKVTIKGKITSVGEILGYSITIDSIE